MASHKKLYRSDNGKMIGGVAAGVAEYSGMDPLLIRLFFVALVILGGGGILLYLVLWMVVPRDPDATTISFDNFDNEERPRGGFKIFLKAVAAALLIAGIISYFVDGAFFTPFLLGIGLGLYYFSRNSQDESSIGERFGLYRSATDRKILGVFGGLADRLEMDPTVLRVVGVILLIAGGGVMIPLYLLYALLIPVERDETRVERIIIV